MPSSPRILATRALDNVREHLRIPNRQLHHWTRFTQIPCSERDECLEKYWTPAQQSRNDFFGKSDLHNVASFTTQSSAKTFGPHRYLGETFLMRSKLAIPVLVVTSLFGSTLIASAQNQPAPGASNEGTISPGATSGKKTQKGTTTGSTARSGANKGGATDPSAQDNAASGADTTAAPKSGSRY